MISRPPKESVAFPAAPACPLPVSPPPVSPLLASLLSMALKTGDLRHAPFSLLREIYPYVCKSDQKAIASLFGCQKMAEEIAALPRENLLHSYRRPLTNQQKMLGLLHVFKKFGGSPAQYDLAETLLSMNGQPEFSRMLSLFNALGGETTMGPKMQQMQSMLQMMQAMGNKE